MLCRRRFHGFVATARIHALCEHWALKRRPSLLCEVALLNIQVKFWYRFIFPDEGLLDAGFTIPTKTKILDDYPTFSGPMLEKWFREKLMESGNYREIGSWWEMKGDQNEVDIVAIGVLDKTAFVAEVKRQRKSFHERAFIDKVEHLKTTILHGYDITTYCLTLADM